ncbi:glycosyltransferase [Microbacterium sp. NPDC058389]|uniref:glycosyltransferase n=1 Tax=Microbacterium sp. NPDC058389 TaxID=3346475 RepID=UPI003666BDBA
MTRMSIVIPAHDEGPLVRIGLEHMLADAEPGEFEVVVVANGCSDDTADQARRVGGVTVVEIDRASKILALNAGDAAARGFPRAYVDSDVRISTATLRALAAALDETTEPRAAAPRLRVDTARTSRPVRAYYRVWALSDYRGDGHIGSGVYAVNAAGRARWDAFPDVIADDRFVQQRFRPAERRSLDGEEFVVAASKDMRTHIRRGIRIERGNRELPAAVQLAAHEPARRRYLRLLGRVAVRPALWVCLPFYLYGFAAAKVGARSGGAVTWSRDDSLRETVRA